jgi:cysteine-rich repeat protein
LGGHIARGDDWGANQSAGGISGSPYHMRFIELCVPDRRGINCKGGNQDRSMSIGTVVAPVCGDGTINGDEECEQDGDCVTGEVCNECACETAPYCGDGNLDEGEECDDGNNNNDDGCSALCDFEYASITVAKNSTHNATFNFTDPRNAPFTLTNGQSITYENLTANGTNYTFTENLSLGWNLSSVECVGGIFSIIPNSTSILVQPHPNEQIVCTFSNAFVVDLGFCGDGNLDEGEECDDGNNVDGDGCASDCVIEYACPEETLLIEGDDLWDAWVYEYTYLNWNQFNYGGHSTWQVGTRTTTDNAKGRTFFRLNLSELPTLAKLIDANLQVYMTRNPNIGSCIFPMSLNRIDSGIWIEGNQAPGGIAIYPEISWLNQQNVNISVTDKVIFMPNTSDFTTINLTEFVKKWENGSWSNLGFVMKRDIEGTSQQCVYTGISSEYPDSTEWTPRKPKALIKYIPTECPFCGDNVTNEDEECDDGNNVTTDGCNACKLTYCGDEVVQNPNGNNQTEQCESDEGCSTGQTCVSCQCESSTYCGDGIVQQPNGNGFNESCDDGANGNLTDECYDDCTLTFCGDGYIQTPNGYGQNEDCETGDERVCLTDTGYNGTEICNISGVGPKCQYNPCESEEYCGDGILQEPPEQCDDGNNVDGDGCSAICETEGKSLPVMSDLLYIVLLFALGFIGYLKSG